MIFMPSLQQKQFWVLMWCWSCHGLHLHSTHVGGSPWTHQGYVDVVLMKLQCFIVITSLILKVYKEVSKTWANECYWDYLSLILVEFWCWDHIPCPCSLIVATISFWQRVWWGRFEHTFLIKWT